MKFSVIVATYNPAWEKLKVTLDSIVSQSLDEYEIIITDDASSDNHFEEITAYLEEKGFDCFRLLSHPQNQGTVKNILSALSYANGKYTKTIGQGDFLYTNEVLKQVYEYLELSGAKGCFGQLRGYTNSDEGNLKWMDFPHPFDLNAYTKKRWNRVRRNLIMYQDHASGAALFCETTSYKEYLQQIRDAVVYEEDIFQVLAGVEGVFMEYLPQYVVGYEMASGVSSRNSKFESLLAEDVKHFYDFLYERYPTDLLIVKRKKTQRYFKYKNLYFRTLFRMFSDPCLVGYLLRHAVVLLRGGYRL